MALMARDAGSVSSLNRASAGGPSDRSTLGTFNASLDTVCSHWVASGERGPNFRCLSVNVSRVFTRCVKFGPIRSDALRPATQLGWRGFVGCQRLYRALAPIAIHERGLGLSLRRRHQCRPTKHWTGGQTAGIVIMRNSHSKLNSVAEVEGVQMTAGLLTEQEVADVDYLRWDLRQVFDMGCRPRGLIERNPGSLAVHAKRSGRSRSAVL
jgi:hypothetical protein